MTKDLGIGGAFIETAELLPFGTNVVIVGRLPGTTAELRLPGIVRWQKADGIGIQFGALGPRETHAILTIVGTAALPGKAHRAA
jgi:type IV pilus assembly protein PilZ